MTEKERDRWKRAAEQLRSYARMISDRGNEITGGQILMMLEVLKEYENALDVCRRILAQYDAYQDIIAEPTPEIIFEITPDVVQALRSVVEPIISEEQ